MMIRWEDTINEIDEEIHDLYFSHHYGEEELICVLFRGIDSKEWLFTSELLKSCFENLFNFTGCEKVDLHDAKVEIESKIYEHYEDEMKYHKEILDELDC